VVWNDDGTKGASMNQIMVNAVEFDALLKEVEYLKARESKAQRTAKRFPGSYSGT
jgi:hypothetical protein